MERIGCFESVKFSRTWGNSPLSSFLGALIFSSAEVVVVVVDGVALVNLNDFSVLKRWSFYYFFSLRIRLKCNDQCQMHFSLKFFGHEFFCFSLEIWYFGNVNSITDIWNCSGQRLMNWSERKWKSFIICTHSAITDNYSDNYLMLLEYYNRDGLIWYHIQYDQKWWHQQYDTKKRWIF